MFFGAVPVDCIEQIVKIVPFADWSSIYTCCSGSFRIEKALTKTFPGKPIHANDVALYSTVIGRLALDEPMRVDFVGEMAYVEEILAQRQEGFLARAAAVLLTCEIARFRGKSLYAKRRREWYRQHFVEMLDKAIAKLSLTVEGIKLASFSPIDWREHVENAIKAGAGIAAFPPFFKGDYEAQYRFVTENTDWDAPTYALYDPRTLPSIVDRIDESGIPYIVLTDQTFEGRQPVLEYQKGLKVPHYAYASSRESSLRHKFNHATPFRYRPFELRDARETSKCRITLGTQSQCNFIKDVYLAKTIRHSKGVWTFLVWVDDMLAGIIVYKPAINSHKKKTKDLLLLSDTTTSREGKISKLVAVLATCETVVGYIHRRQVDRYDRVLTVAKSRHPVSMKYRDIYELIARHPADDPSEGNSLTYASSLRKETAQELYDWWWRKFGRKEQAAALAHGDPHRQSQGAEAA